MVRLKVSYERPEELQKVITLLGATLHSMKRVLEQKGKYKRAYISLIELKDVQIELDE